MSQPDLPAALNSAIKALQRQYCEQGLSKIPGSSTTVLGVCAQLDLIMRDGLSKKVREKNAYWLYVRQFMHKSSVEQIEQLHHVKTDHGRGRAWIRHALNECLLEGYLHMFLVDETLKHEYYVPEALLCDHDRLNLLVTVVAGLEMIKFEIEIDTPLLDPIAAGAAVVFDSQAKA